MDFNSEEIQKQGIQARQQNKKLFARIRKRKPKDLDDKFEEIHDEVFENLDCLDCANCCKTTSPIFLRRDIERLAKHFKMTPGDFTAEYLREDEDHDYVLKTAPCPFLGADNYCSVYDKRPKACEEYPHTNRKDMQKLLNLTLVNAEICPAVQKIVDGIREAYPPFDTTR